MEKIHLWPHYWRNQTAQVRKPPCTSHCGRIKTGILRSDSNKVCRSGNHPDDVQQHSVHTGWPFWHIWHQGLLLWKADGIICIKRIHLSDIQHEIIDQYNLEAIQNYVWVYIDAQKLIPGLKQSSKISNDRLCTHLEKYGYAPVWHTPTLWKDETRNIIFTLVVDNFGIKFTIRQDAAYLSSTLEYLYVITKYW